MPTNDKDGKSATDVSRAGEVAGEKAVSEHRRKLIKASAAVVPAVMTLHSGAAVALTSIQQCIAGDAATAAIDPPELVWGDTEGEGPLDEWTRVKGKEVEKQNTTYYCVKNNSNAWECYDSNGDAPPGNGNSLQDSEIEAGTDVYLLAYVDTEADAYTWYPKSLSLEVSTATPITGSCLCSVNPDISDLV